MKLKRLKEKTIVRVKSESEYLLLLKLLEKAGYRWNTEEIPTDFSENFYIRDISFVVLYPDELKIGCFGINTVEKALRKVVKYEVGDKVRIREDLAKCKDEGPGITYGMKELAGAISTIECIESDGDFRLECGFAWKKKWLEPVFENKEE